MATHGFNVRKHNMHWQSTVSLQLYLYCKLTGLEYTVIIGIILFLIVLDVTRTTQVLIATSSGIYKFLQQKNCSKPLDP